MDLRVIVSKLGRKKPLDAVEMTEVMESLMSGQLLDTEIEQFLLGLREKGITVTELVAAAKVMRRKAVKLSKEYPDLLDTCGTGGDNQHTLNISTLAAIVVCASGVRIAKHGNRSVSSVCGSADLLELLGVKIELAPEWVERSIRETGFGFFFAPRFHAATRFAMPARKKIQGKTIFNLLGPLSNPAGAGYQVVGVYEEKLVPLMAEALLALGTRSAMVVHGKDGLDEISLGAETRIAEISEGRITAYDFSPDTIGFQRMKLDAVRCNKKEESAAAALRILKGEKGPGCDMVLLNAGAALRVAGKASSIGDGVRLAAKALSSGAAYAKLEEIKLLSNGMAE